MSNETRNSPRKTESVSLFLFLGGGLYRQKKCTCCGTVRVTWKSSKDVCVNGNNAETVTGSPSTHHDRKFTAPCSRRERLERVAWRGERSAHLASSPMGLHPRFCQEHHNNVRITNKFNDLGAFCSRFDSLGIKHLKLNVNGLSFSLCKSDGHLYLRIQFSSSVDLVINSPGMHRLKASLIPQIKGFTYPRD